MIANLRRACNTGVGKGMGGVSRVGKHSYMDLLDKEAGAEAKFRFNLKLSIFLSLRKYTAYIAYLTTLFPDALTALQRPSWQLQVIKATLTVVKWRQFS